MLKYISEQHKLPVEVLTTIILRLHKLEPEKYLKYIFATNTSSTSIYTIRYSLCITLNSAEGTG